MGFIYKLTLKKESRKAYIGQTIRDIHERLKEHQLESSGCKAISAAIKKHGWENFDKEWYEVPDEDLNFYEEMLVALLGTLSPGGYNLKEGGGNGKPSDESRQKMSEAQTGEKNHNYGKTMSDESRQKLSKSHCGKTHTEETKQMMSEAHCGKTHTEETKQKLSRSLTGRTLSDETKQKIIESKKGENNHMSKKIYQYDLTNNFIQSFESCEEAARHFNKKSASNIRKCVRGKQPTAYGFKWICDLNV